MASDPSLIPLTSAISAVTPIVLGLAAAVVALWRKVAAVEVRERADCAERISGLEGRLDALEKDGAHWRDRWAREVQRNVELASMPSDGRAKRPPAPSWEEDTMVRRDRAAITEEALRRYVDESVPPGPPRPRLPSRPK